MLSLGPGHAGASDGPRPLVITTQPYADEAFAGVLARAARSNVLGSVQAVLQEAGLCLAHPGTAGQEVGDRLPALAQMLGCSAEALAALAHPYLDEDRRLVRWGEGVLRRGDLLLDRRRIAPAALRDAAYVRAAWQCRHLPYDADTGELLLERCPACSKTLRWSRAWGVGSCEWCRADLASLERPKLHARRLPAYQRFAALTSVIAPVRAQARVGLAPELARLAEPVLIDLVIGAGAALGPSPKAIGRSRLRQLAAAEMGGAIGRGMALISGWPHAFRQHVAKRFRACDDKDGQRLLQAVRALGNARAFGPEQAALVQNAVPEAFADTRRAHGSFKGEVALGREVAAAAGLRAHEVCLLADRGILPVLQETAAKRRNIQLAAAPAFAFARARRSSHPITRTEAALGLPRYGVEQLIAAGLIDQERHPGVLLLDALPRITDASLAVFSKRFNSIVSSGPPPGAVLLRTVSRRIGGGLKPWAQIIGAILNGQLPAYHDEADLVVPLTKRVLIRSDAALVAAEFWQPETAADAFRSPIISQADACEILNLDPLQIRPLVNAGCLSFQKDGKRLSTRLTAVLAYAKRMIPPAELAHRLGMRADAVHATVRAWPGVERIPGGWKREQVNLHLAGAVSSL